ncbi:hypothetical protein CC86DRAFT_315963 [Ophiobolus disseminans]|uniref:Xylanolytic transcriptional activator regulatory domain-containing protein n=1 Tax=Ophiobolus disseminans TaxID=1469910 RepID=A0A6A7ADB2_9PLEO|nr:hypothetical protein CC86DRAFT_315963 [Ophiobolus disseminans]
MHKMSEAQWAHLILVPRSGLPVASCGELCQLTPTETKCSGTRPQCTNCERNGDECVYEQPRRDRLREALNKNELLIALLKEIKGSLSGEHAKTVNEVLQQYEHDTPPDTPALLSRYMEQRPRSSSDDMDHDSLAPDETQVSASVGSNEDLDFLEEDLLDHQGRDETGFLGRNSQVQWMRTLQRKLDLPTGEPSDLPYAPPGDSEHAFSKRSEALHQRQKESGNTGPLSDYYFYLDNENIDAMDQVEPHSLPPLETASALFANYKSTVQEPFRILDDEFEAQLYKYYEIVQSGATMTVDAKWKAVLNLVLAIGARYSHLVGADWQADPHDHLVYMSRAVYFLGLKNITTLVCAPDRLLIQATGLFSFYYLTIGHVSRAWYMIGISIRYAQAAGLHLRNEDTSVSIHTKRARAQTWWALHSIECILTSITGRPRVVERKDCTVPQLRNLKSTHSSETRVGPGMSTPQEKVASPTFHSARGKVPAVSKFASTTETIDSFLDAWTQLDLLQHKTLSTLYAARTAVHSWKHMQGEIASLSAELDRWALKILPHGPFDAASSTEPNPSREHLLLYFYYQSAKICITRPCLCRLDRRIKGQSEESANFNQVTATSCIQAALDLSSWLPEPANSTWLYERGPWWSSVHIIMQAITVLLLELAQDTNRADRSKIAECVEKLANWLEAMKSVDSVADRAYSVVCKMLNRNRQSIQNAIPHQWPQGLLQAFEDQPSDAVGIASQAYSNTDLQYRGEPTWPSAPYNDDGYNQANLGSFDLNPLAGPLPHAYGNNVQFSQEPYPFFYGNFTTLFDEQMDFDYGGNTNQEDWSAMQDQRPPQ